MEELLERLKKPHENLTQDSRSPGRVFNPQPERFGYVQRDGMYTKGAH
jgi:hypothetical protein